MPIDKPTPTDLGKIAEREAEAAALEDDGPKPAKKATKKATAKSE